MSGAVSVQEEESNGFVFRATILVQMDANIMVRQKQKTPHVAKRKRRPLFKNSR